MDELERDPHAAGREDDEESIRRLLAAAGPRPAIPPGDLEAITRAAHAAWRAEVENRRPHRRPRATALIVALAASVALAVGLGWWWRRGAEPAAPPVVARVEAAAGLLHEGRALAAGDEIPAGARLRTGGPGEAPAGRASLRLASGATLRLAAGTAVRLAAAHHLDLERGAIYLDTGAAGGGTPLEVRSPLGTATDIGTRFTVALAEGAGGGLRVRVREGAVAVEGAGRRYVAPAGQEVVLRPDGSVARHDVPPYGEAWRWVVAAAPAFAIEGRSVAELLDWVASETGWSIRFADDAVAAEAEAIVLHGSMGELPADEAPFAVLPGAGLEAELDRGTLLVRRAR